MVVCTLYIHIEFYAIKCLYLYNKRKMWNFFSATTLDCEKTLKNV